MPSDIYLSLLTSDFSGEEAKKVEFAAIMGYALDSAKKKEQLEEVYLCYVPFFAFKLSEGNYMIFNSIAKTHSALEVFSPPSLKEVQALMKEEFSSLQDKYKALKMLLTDSRSKTLEITGALTGEQVNSLAPMITTHMSSPNSNFKKLSPQLQRADIQRELQKISKDIISISEFDTHIAKLLDEIEDMFEKELGTLQEEEKKIKTYYDTELEKTKKDIQVKIKEIEAEEQRKHKEIDDALKKELKELIESVKNSNQWRTLNKDFTELINAKKDVDAKVGTVSIEKDISNVIGLLRNMHDELSTLGANLNSTTSMMENVLREIEDKKQQAIVDKRNVSDRMAGEKEQQKNRIQEIEAEKKMKLEEVRAKQEETKSIIQQLNKDRKTIETQMANQFKATPMPTLSGELLGIESTQAQATIYVPVAICKYKERSKYSFVVLPPVEIPPKMKKPKSAPLVSLNARIGFDCIGTKAKEFLKKPLEELLITNPDLQAEVQGENNRLSNLGKLSELNAGLKLLQDRKDFPKKNADQIIAYYREYFAE